LEIKKRGRRLNGRPVFGLSLSAEKLRDANDLSDSQVVRVNAGIGEHDRPDRGVMPPGY